ncbi:Acetyl-CoA:oxalate CoA-transferase [Paraburkholderia domus]|uniref:CaiB/BaiF CoA transferase family protein n=1 Tax=Paraburkholderia domus TaxID=2793075 RepID=UPI001914C773|nr:CoA transferase [Paraburkholderia domus]MBK5091272.1 CoA transferase [Burkholderia sp. R-69927]CAE6931468.1 Acetyl-CoA:oxalate CoA-transferase [Paraburkholderia domus]
MLSLPLSGIRVLDLSNVLSGPFCTYQLTLLGADVLKIENPVGGDLARRLGADPKASARNMGASFVAVNAGKESLTLNLKHEVGKEILRKLVAGADVLVENFRPGVMDRLGLGAKSLLEVNPRLVYCAISGFGNDGPLAHRPAYDQIIQGMSGAMSVTGDPDSAPLRVGYPVADTVGGMSAALAICAAVVAAQRTGEGRIIDVSMLEATLSSMGWVVSNYLNAGVSPTPMGNENFTAAPSGTFVCGDGMLNIAANETKQFVALCELIGRPDLPQDERFSERNTRKLHRAELKHEIEAALSTDTARNWEQRMTAAGVPAGLVLSVPEAISQQQLVERKFVHELQDGESVQRVTRAGFRFADAYGETSSGAPATRAPHLSEHTEAQLLRLGFEANDITRLREDGAI